MSATKDIRTADTGEWIVISLGGSLIFPEEGLNISFMKAFRSLILSQIEKGQRFIIVAGGGTICRRYQAAAEEIANPSEDALDEIGISALRTNAHLIQLLFGERVYPGIIDEDTRITEKIAKYPVVVGGAANPGKSTDYNTVCMAQQVGARSVVNLSNIDHVYESDPKENPSARKFENMSWSQYRDLIPKDFSPGLSTPFDPVAAKKAQDIGMNVIIMNGGVENLENYLSGESFSGTTIENE